ncbi:UDP-N-acetylglucosamine 1-carboxyvinyltransferase [Guggenheimella bovis]
MSKFIIEQSPPLKGEVTIGSSKNAVLKIMGATILAEGPCVIENVPDLLDVHVMIEILRALGSEVEFDVESGRMTTNVIHPENCTIDYELSSRIRASVTMMGPLLSRNKTFKVSLPGGDAIGSRKHDLHLKGFHALGAMVELEHGNFEATVEDGLHGATIFLDFPSVGATENIMMAAVKAEGTTIIENAAQEPEITDLAGFLNKMGAKISGAGTSTIRVRGVEHLKGVTHMVIPDRIEAGTYMIATALTKGKVTLKNVLATHLRPIISKLREAGVIIVERDDSILVDATDGYTGFDITTWPYPGYPTDLQAPIIVLLALCKGSFSVKETIYDNRFQHVTELQRMGADVKIEGAIASIYGVDKLEGTKVKATDIRSGAALILAGLVAEGKTEVFDAYHVDRGFSDMEEKLRGLGAKVWKEE